MRIVTWSLILLLTVPSVAIAAEDPVTVDLSDPRFRTANRMTRIGDAGFAGVAMLALVGESQGYDQTWVRIGLAASVGAITIGFVGRKLKRDAERDAERASMRGASQNRHIVSVAPLAGSGIAGVYAFGW